jgi:hypothetical protein
MAVPLAVCKSAHSPRSHTGRPTVFAPTAYTPEPKRSERLGTRQSVGTIFGSMV